MPLSIHFGKKNNKYLCTICDNQNTLSALCYAWFYLLIFFKLQRLYRKKPGMLTIASKLPQNLSKNRYRDITACECTCVCLSLSLSLPLSLSLCLWIICHSLLYSLFQMILQEFIYWILLLTISMLTMSM